MLSELGPAFSAMEDDPDVRCGVLSPPGSNRMHHLMYHQTILRFLERSRSGVRGQPVVIILINPPDQCAQIRIDLWSASERPGFPTPVPAKAGPMPTHQGLGPDDRDGLEDRCEPSIQHDQEQAIPIRELDATAHPPPQHNQLMSECRG
jgi:hypothetical protein